MAAAGAARRRALVAGAAAAALAVVVAAGTIAFALLEGTTSPPPPPPPAPATPTGTAYVDGISDQNVAYWNGDVWSGGPPASPFARFIAGALVSGTPAPLRYARYVVAYDVMCDTAGPAYATFESWLADVEQIGLRPDVAFWYGDFDGNRCASLPLIPTSAAEYNGTAGGGAVAAFLARFPQVTTIEPWNEPNDGRGPDVPAPRAAAFWLAVARDDCATRSCDAVIAGDFSDATRNLVHYERRYVAALDGAQALDWGIHPYAAVNHERERTLLEFEAGLPNPAADRVWYTEVGAFYCTPKQNRQRGYTDAQLQALQERRAHYLVTTLMQYPFAPVHVFYYEFMYKNDLPGPCATDDSALYAPAGRGAPLQYQSRAAVQDILPFASPPVALPAPAPGASIFYARVDWRAWRDGWRATRLRGPG